ncbi:3-deoxy-7-phosphoheptulonate synthase [Candidatus Sumerlaeota bacterium]|nr:3-deoxy-7-phosphoheptulonate synthase [Candidatus Sumerlaeota bacterium]
MEQTQNINIQRLEPLIPPREIKHRFPMNEAANRVIVQGRRDIIRIINGEDDRLMIIAGPCSIHDSKQAMDYAGRLRELADKVRERILIVMRVYFEKPRTTVGWKGLINDPWLNGTFDIGSGLKLARQLLLDINALGLPCGTEMLDPISPQYTADLIAWASIGARTSESQTHRQMASGLSMPVGYKNSTDGSLQTALDAMQAARHPHSFLGINESGLTCIVKTKGNPWAQLILRGGNDGPNYESEYVAKALEGLQKAGAPSGVLIDCSHANALKDYRRQHLPFEDALQQRLNGATGINGMMLESNIHPGNQKLGDDPASLQSGVSITDACIGWEETEALVNKAYDALG